MLAVEDRLGRLCGTPRIRQEIDEEQLSDWKGAGSSVAIINDDGFYIFFGR